MAENHITIEQFRNKIKSLPSDEPMVTPGIWYTTQKQHWLGWLAEYNGPGAYSRKNWDRDACFAYNHVVNPGMLLYLIKAIPMAPEIITAAEAASQQSQSMMAQSGSIRKVVPWEMIYQAFWG